MVKINFSESGVIGSHVALRKQCLIAYGFKSLLSYFTIKLKKFMIVLCGIRLMVRQEIPNLLMWVRFLHSAPARLTQRIEYFPTKKKVVGLNPTSGIDYN